MIVRFDGLLLQDCSWKCFVQKVWGSSDTINGWAHTIEHFSIPLFVDHLFRGCYPTQYIGDYHHHHLLTEGNSQLWHSAGRGISIHGWNMFRKKMVDGKILFLRYPVVIRYVSGKLEVSPWEYVESCANTSGGYAIVRFDFHRILTVSIRSRYTSITRFSFSNRWTPSLLGILHVSWLSLIKLISHTVAGINPDKCVIRIIYL